ncbi:hypothetical protein GWK16_09615 [Roseomonas sp. JC162]|uniref:Glycosyltransferase n=1 Tax=Neoroseomonas marina TaxID=1232220 RepID=A0A848EDA9_9PROT|nr:hypothetical protein [Neoroseomonas marina]NMJ41497.1 hypothetical protein [Neoroseomonas marina]
MRLPRIVVDGEDSSRSRGLLVVSALHLAAEGLHGIAIAVMNADDPPMAAAVEVLQGETGLRIEPWPASVAPRNVLREARLFVSVAVDDTAHLPLGEAAALGVPVIAPVQFPAPHADADALALLRAAHDPKALAGRMLRALGRIAITA